MNAGRVAWLVGAYLIGTLPSAYLVATMAGARPILAAARRDVSEGDAHVVLDVRVGKRWGTLAAALDVLKALIPALVARHVAHLPPAWLAGVGVLLVVGHCFPFYLRRLAGRGLSAGAGVLLALVPLAMVVAGVVIAVGHLAESTGPASTVGFALTPVVAFLVGEPGAVVAMCGGILGVILARRLVGVAGPAREAGWGRAVARRLVFDADRPR